MLRPEARILIRSNYSDRMPNLLMYDYFPRARQLDAAMYPTFDEAVAAFSAGGFAIDALDVVRVAVAANERAAFERLRLRAISTFEFMHEDEITEGFAAMESGLAARADRGPVFEEASLLTLARGS